MDPLTRVDRERKRLTELLVLREILLAPSSLRGVATRLGVTVQAVSVHVRRMTKAGLVERGDAGYQPTAPGIQALQEGFRDLKRSVDDTLARMTVVKATSAVAGNAIREGDRVGLLMEAGVLVARTGRGASSTGVAVHDAADGEEVLVRDLAGVVDLRPGRLVVLRVPAPEEGGSRRVAPRKLRALLRERGVHPDRVAALGTPARVLSARLQLAPPLDFAPVEAAFHAAELGLSVVLLVSRELVKDALAVLDARNERTLVRVPIEILDAPAEAGA